MVELSGAQVEEEEFVDVPDEIVDITIASRGPTDVVLQWLEPCDNARQILHYQVYVQPWQLGEKHGPLPPQEADDLGHSSTATPDKHEQSIFEHSLLLKVASSEVLCPHIKQRLCNFRLHQPPVVHQASALTPSVAQLPSSLCVDKMPLGAWVSARAGNCEGWAEWARPVLIFFRKEGIQATLHTWGLGEDGRLGRGPEAVTRGVCAEGGVVEALRDECIRDIALGSHSAIITSDDRLFVWGTFMVEDAPVDGKATTESLALNNANGESDKVDLIVEPAFVSTNFVPETVACGRFVTAVISAEGNLFTWGPNDNYQCGCNGPSVVRTLTKLHLPRKIAVVRVALGEFHGVGLTAEGVAFAWGMEQGPEISLGRDGGVDLGQKFGKLPQRAPLNQPEPRMIDMPCCVVDVAAGAYHSALITNNGQLWTWGNNDKGQLGHGLDLTDVNTPRRVQTFEGGPGQRVIHVSLGGFHSAAIDESRRLFTWGDSKRGQCGHGKVVIVDKPTPLKLAASEAQCVGVSCGGFFTIFAAADTKMDERSRYYVCGWGKEGCLGFGQACKRMLTPQPLPKAPCGHWWVCLQAGMVHVAGLLSKE